MPDFRQTGDKPMRPQDHLGPDVKLTQERLENDVWAQNTLREIGKTMTPAEHTYMGSIALHYYKTGDAKLLLDANKIGGIATKQQLCLGDINEYIALMGLANLQITLKQQFGRIHKTTDRKDQRGNT